MAHCATPTGSAGHAGATTNLKLTFHLDHSVGADQRLGQSYQPRRDDDFDVLEDGVIVGRIFLAPGPLRALDAGTPESAESVDGPRRVLNCGLHSAGRGGIGVRSQLDAAVL